MTNRNTLLEHYNILNYIRRYNGSYTYFNEIKSLLQLSKALNRCLTIEELIVAMKADKRFTERDFAKLEMAITHFLEGKNHKKITENRWLVR